MALIPNRVLIDVRGTLYGTTYTGGSSDYYGAVFALDGSTGAEEVLYSFCSQANCTDGEYPEAGLIDFKGTLYGTTSLGGAHGAGIVFSLNPKTGTEKVLHSFCSQPNCLDGGAPMAGLIDMKGVLLGTTEGGGTSTHSGGTVFSIDPSTGAEQVIYSFCSQPDCTDGAGPRASLIYVKGTLYGTTNGGGTSGLGTVFSLDPKTGTESVLHSFGSGSDGVFPRAGLIDVNGTLYGSTLEGGANLAGTVFSLDPTTGSENVLYAFCGQNDCADGGNPSGSLIDVNGTLYGTTVQGGGANQLGTVFSIDPSGGAENVLYSFCPSQQLCLDGASPGAGVIDVKGALFGTTEYGGAPPEGTVFALTKR